VTGSLELLALTAEQMRALARDERAGVAAALGRELPAELVASRWWLARADLLDADPADEWSAVRLVVRDGTVVANAGFHGPPDADGRVEAGYTVYAAYRRQGIARAVLGQFVEQARRAPSVRLFRLTVAPDNAASQALTLGAGFARVGEQMDDEDGLEEVFELDVSDSVKGGTPVADPSGGNPSGGDPSGADSIGAGTTADNRRWWDAVAPAHAAGSFYDLPGFIAGRDDLRPFEDAELGPVAGLDLAHLQCHLGTDTLSLARRGARVTGLDVSAESTAVARRLAAACGLPADFVTADVRDAVDALGGRDFDVVYTGIGALCWLDDLDAWAGVVASLLRPGGVLYLVEIAPLVEGVWEGGGWQVVTDVVYTGPTPSLAAGSYATGGAPVAEHPVHSRNWSIGAVVTAVANAGLRVELLGEQELTDNPLPWLDRGEDRLCRFPPGTPRYPVTWSLRARRPAS